MNLKQLFFGLLLSASTWMYAQQETAITPSVRFDFVGELTTQQLEFLKTTYHWDAQDVLIVNYRQPLSDCHYDNSWIDREGKKWEEDFYKDIDLSRTLRLTVLYNGEKVPRKLDNITYFDDKDDFLYDTFFNRKKTCHGVIVINKNGDYMQYNGEYSPEQVDTFQTIVLKYIDEKK